MKIIVLAAGMGERLMPLTKTTPKSLLDMGTGRTLLEEQLTRMEASGVITECVLVVGYLADQIEIALRACSTSTIKIRTIFNPFFSVSNNLASLWLAKNEMSDDFLITNGDCIFPADVYRDFVGQSRSGITLCVNKKKSYDDDDMKVMLSNDEIQKVSKQIAIADTVAESPGLSIVRGHAARDHFVGHLESLLRQPEMLNRFWLEVFNSLIDEGQSVRPWIFPPGTKWQEVDFHLDLDTVRSVLFLGDI